MLLLRRQTRTTQVVRAATALALLLGFGMLNSEASSSTPSHQRRGDVGPLESGTSSYLQRTFAWTDYVYDDRGDRPSPSQPETTAVFGRDQGAGVPYPAGAENTADLVQLQLQPRRTGLRVGAVLQTLRQQDHPMVGIAIDTDANPASGAYALPGGSWDPLGPLGVEVLVVLTSRHAEVYRYTGSAWSRAAHMRVEVQRYNGSGILRATLPTELSPAAAGTWRVFGVVGLSSDSWLRGGPIFDLACVKDGFVRWQSKNQAEILGRRRNSDQAACVIDLAKLTAGVTQLPDPRAPGQHTMLYRSRYDLGGGVVPGSVVLGVQGKDYLGAYQPYRVMIPPRLPRHPALLIDMHGLSANHLHGNSEGGALGLAFSSVHPTTEPPGLANSGAYTYEVPAVVIYPFGRSDTSWEGFHEADLLEAIQDVTRRYLVDRERVVLSGASLGGIATFDIAARNPDLFSSAVAIVGRPSDNASLASLRNLPIAQVNNMLDPLIQQPAPTEAAQQLTKLGYEHRYWLLHRRGHEHPTQLTQCIYLAAITRTRLRDPAQVVYRYDPVHDVANPRAGIDLRHDRAYWVSGLRVRPGVSSGQIEATSFAIPRRTTTPIVASKRQENITSGRDLCGARADVKTSDSWYEESVSLRSERTLPARNGARLVLDGIRAVTLDAQRMKLRSDRTIELAVEADGVTQIRLNGAWSPRTVVTVDGKRVKSEVTGRAIVITADLRGAHKVVVRSR